jgi:hypothetical protein
MYSPRAMSFAFVWFSVKATMPSTLTALVSTHGSASYGELYREVFAVGPVLNTHGLGRKEVYICWESRVLVHGIKAR